MKRTFIVTVLMIGVISRIAWSAEPDAARGRELFGRACVACHSLAPDKNMTGPTLSGVWSRKAGSLPSFSRYSEALKSFDVVWDDAAMDSWLKDPKAFIPGNHMVFPGIPDDLARADLLAFLRKATQPGAQNAPGMEGMMGMGADVPNLKTAPPGSGYRESNIAETRTA